MFRKLATLAISGVVMGTITTASAGGLYAGATNTALTSLNEVAPQSLIKVHSKRCKFYHPDGYKYKAHCPHEYRKGSRKKRAGIGAGIGAAAGAIIGGITGGGRGAAIGAAAGAGAGALGGAASVRKCWYFDDRGRRVKVRCRQ